MSDQQPIRAENDQPYGERQQTEEAQRQMPLQDAGRANLRGVREQARAVRERATVPGRQSNQPPPEMFMESTRPDEDVLTPTRRPEIRDLLREKLEEMAFQWGSADALEVLNGYLAPPRQAPAVQTMMGRGQVQGGVPQPARDMALLGRADRGDSGDSDSLDLFAPEGGEEVGPEPSGMAEPAAARDESLE